jgi:TM2 domain-containing membrane protein YozV
MKFTLKAAAVAAVLLSFQIGLDQFERSQGLTGVGLYLLDDGLLAFVFVGLVAYLLRVRYRERERHRQAINRMNHAVRNALQSILYIDYLNEEGQRQQLTESVVRIEQAVREVSRVVSLRKNRENVIEFLTPRTNETIIPSVRDRIYAGGRW